MTETNDKIEASEPNWLKPVVDYVPLIAFFGSYKYSDDIILATKVIIGVTALAIILSLLVARRVPVMPLVTAIVIGVFGGLTVYFQDDTFIKMKPTIIQCAFAIILGAGLLLKRVWLKPIFGGAIDMTENAWRTLTWRFVMFFFASAALNEIVWRTQSTDFWVSFKVFGLMGISIVFVLSQMPFISRHTIHEDNDTDEDS
ncbi:MAG: septation protein A [Alphaproteobacteria bacterium]